MKKIDPHQYVIDKLHDIFNHDQKVAIPPPVFTMMHGRVLEFNENEKNIKISFPIKEEYLNPFGNMQGGMIAAAIDNTFGPLSMLTAPLNFTRKLEIKYKRQIQKTIKNIIVNGEYIERKDRHIYLYAVVNDHDENIMATANAIHWIVESS